MGVAAYEHFHIPSPPLCCFGFVTTCCLPLHHLPATSLAPSPHQSPHRPPLLTTCYLYPVQRPLSPHLQKRPLPFLITQRPPTLSTSPCSLPPALPETPLNQLPSPPCPFLPLSPASTQSPTPRHAAAPARAATAARPLPLGPLSSSGLASRGMDCCPSLHG